MSYRIREGKDSTTEAETACQEETVTAYAQILTESLGKKVRPEDIRVEAVRGRAARIAHRTAAEVAEVEEAEDNERAEETEEVEEPEKPEKTRKTQRTAACGPHPKTSGGLGGNTEQHRNAKENKMSATKSVNEMTLRELTALYNLENPGNKRKCFSDRKAASAAITKARAKKGVTASATKGVAKGVAKDAAKNEKPESRCAMIRDLFSRRKSAKVEELMELTKWDRRTVHCAMAGMRKSDRLVTAYDRATSTYSLC
jgi:hypothetical protein